MPKASNTRTSLKRKRSFRDPMAAYDQLPAELRKWLSQAALPWSPRSALRSWKGYLRKENGDAAAAARRLNELEEKMLTVDRPRVWCEV